MDPVALLLDAPRSRRTAALRVLMSGDWAISVEDDAPLTVCALLRGDCHLVRGPATHALTAGDVLIVSGTEPYVLAVDPARAPTVTIGPGGACRGGDGRDLAEPMALGVRAWGNDPEGHHDLLIATYASESEVGRQLLASLPREIIERPEVGALAELIVDQLAVTAPGQATVVNRLLDVLLIATVRQWTARDDTGPSWWSVGRDPEIAAALGRMDADDTGALTPERLAADVGLSRATFTKRFREVVGVPPGEYARRTRLARAADALRDEHLTVEAVGRRFGYATPFSFSAAFKAHFGTSPSAHRRGITDAPATPEGQGADSEGH
ncbi:AraC family transcriptional regulator [Mariniluteicoccus flavus]